jgi:hypothetical protein
MRDASPAETRRFRNLRPAAWAAGAVLVLAALTLGGAYVFRAEGGAVGGVPERPVTAAAVGGADAEVGAESGGIVEEATVGDPAAGEATRTWPSASLLAPSPAVPAGRVARPAAVRGIYLNAWAMASARKFARLVELAERTELNAFVLDVKDVTGYLTYASRVPLAQALGADGEVKVRDIRGLLEELRRREVYPIARIVVFKDPLLAARRPELSIQKADGAVWVDHNGEHWVDPYNREIWDYHVALAREAVELGFAEVQWDYVRFPDVPGAYMRTAVYPAAEGRRREDAIRQFLLYSRERLADLEVPVTADVFGLTTSVANDMGIGQRWDALKDAADALLPMVYPSHYARGTYGVGEPNARPYEIVRRAMEDAVRRTGSGPGMAAIVPWLQDFSLGAPRYGAAEVRAQIQAVYDAGLSEWILWNPGSNYNEGALATRDGQVPQVWPGPGALPGEPAAAPATPAPDTVPQVLGEPVALPAEVPPPGS